jgi:uncharacterized protein involved in exopolysaccharide biosynthesis
MDRGYSTVQIAQMLGMDKQMLLSLLEVPSCVQAPQGDDASASMRPVAEVLAPVDDLSSERMVIASENRAISGVEELKMDAAAGSDGGSFRHWRKVILIPALLAPLAGFLVSYGFTAKYTSQSEVLVSPPRIPDAVVQSIFTEDLTQHITTIQQRVLSSTLLRPMVERLGLAKEGQNVEDVISNIQPNMTIEPVPDFSDFGPTANKKAGTSPVPGFYVNYTASTARDAQQICAALTSMVIEEDLKMRQEQTNGTTDFLTRQVEDAKQHLDDLDKQMAAFKNQHVASSLGIDYDNARKVYQDDLAKQSTARMASQVEQQQQGEQMALLNPATLPDTPEFPNRLLFAVGGLIAGLVFGTGLALWLRYRAATLRIAPIPTTL